MQSRFIPWAGIFFVDLSQKIRVSERGVMQFVLLVSGKEWLADWNGWARITISHGFPLDIEWLNRILCQIHFAVGGMDVYEEIPSKIVTRNIKYLGTPRFILRLR